MLKSLLFHDMYLSILVQIELSICSHLRLKRIVFWSKPLDWIVVLNVNGSVFFSVVGVVQVSTAKQAKFLRGDHI